MVRIHDLYDSQAPGAVGVLAEANEEVHFLARMLATDLEEDVFAAGRQGVGAKAAMLHLSGHLL